MLEMLSAVLGTLGHYLGRIFFTAAAALAIYFAVKAARNLFNVYQEAFVMLTVALGRRWMPKERSLRIQPYLCRTADLDDVSIDECFRFHYQAFQPADDSITRDQVFAMYQKTLQKYSHVVLCREKLDGSLRGLVLVGLEYKKTHTVLKVGLTLTHKTIEVGHGTHPPPVCTSLLDHQNEHLQIVSHQYIIPRQPSSLRQGGSGRDQKDCGGVCSQHPVTRGSSMIGTFCLRRRTVIVNTHMAEISERELQNPHIRFFNERNPGWREGDQLVTMGKVMLKTLLIHGLKVTLPKFFKQSPSSNIPRGNVAGGNVSRRKAEKLRTRLTRGLTYQDMVAGIHSLRFHARERNEKERNKELKHRDSYIKRLYSHSDDEDYNVDL
ncbi:hypothetical protein GBAR_LOCUS17569 [Geodia barretti]|uniref:Uncharacterized protein n=2 Tax=Geodia barretti TaxID=519541 RepID=A0AA35SK18_GEOBA|nr:hypothetical protein GBAR_LOCUS17569 [Geodia barretti]